jgi:phospholipid/cholesterol/gamma-HCH transport system substrate-binding protein
MFDKTFLIYADFKNVAGLQVGNFVRFAGINVGTVDNITIMNDTTVQVSLLLQSSVRKFIKQNATANIGSDGLMGDKIIQVSAGTPGTVMVKENSLITGRDPLNMEQVVTKLNAITTNAESLTDNLASIVEKGNNSKGSLGRLLNNDKLARELEQTVSSTHETVQNIRKSAEGFSDNMQAAKHSFLLRGYFKKKEKQRIADSTKKANQQNAQDNNDSKKKN